MGSGDADDLRVAARQPGDIPFAAADQEPGDRRDVRDLPARGIGLVLADDLVHDLAAVRFLERDGRTESHGVTGRRRHDLGRALAFGPVAQVALYARDQCTVGGRARRRQLRLQSLDAGIDLRAPRGCDEITVRADLEFRQLLPVRAIGFLDECPAHPRPSVSRASS